MSLPLHAYAYGYGPEDPMELPEPIREDLNLADVSERLDEAVWWIGEALGKIPHDAPGRADIVSALIAFESEGWGQ
ncbi:hypothetical protein [Spiribacter onubensis]|uniref:Uncharacterized protein n=1 Tax=Spiribacter onubensis TaxID=3122420 RepID=A0ABV3S6W7_9GAMM